MLRRRELLGMPHIGYKSGVVYGTTNQFPIIENDYFFITGFISYAPTNCTIAFDARYANNYDYRKHLDSPNNTPFIVMYNALKAPINTNAHWDMTDSSGKRIVRTTSTSFVYDISYVRFCGFLLDINDCYVIDYNTNNLLWKKGM